MFNDTPLNSPLDESIEEDCPTTVLEPDVDLFFDERPQFHLRSLLIAMAVFGILMGLFRNMGIFGALLVFIAACVASCIMVANQWPPRRLMGDFIWGVFMPIVCVVFDPGMIHSLGNDVMTREITPFVLVVYSAISFQILFLSIWLLAARQIRQFAAFFSGVFFAGTVVAICIGLFLLPISIIGTLFGIGLMGFTPFLTGHAYGRRMQQAGAVALRDSPNKAFVFMLLGTIFAIGLPIGIGLLVVLVFPTASVFGDF